MKKGEIMEPSTIVIGIGNEYRGDDAAGLAVIQALKTQDLPPVRLIKGMSDGMSLLACWDATSKIILVDAVSSGAEVGTIYRFDALAQPIPASLSFCSTHAFGVAEALTLAHTLQQLPSTLIVYALEGKNYASGAALSPQVEHAVQKVVAQVEQEVRSWTDPAVYAAESAIPYISVFCYV
jgi:hydrogenase maturation protease